MAVTLGPSINVQDGAQESGRRIWSGTLTGPALYVAGGIALVPSDLPAFTDPLTGLAVLPKFNRVDHVQISVATHTVGAGTASAAFAAWVAAAPFSAGSAQGKVKFYTTAMAEIGGIDISASTFTITIFGQ